MEKRFKTILDQYRQINKDLENPDFVSDQDKIKTLSKELSQISAIAEKIVHLENIENEIRQSQEIISNETDHELKVLAEEEFSAKSKERENLLAELDEEIKMQDPLNKKDIIIEIRAGTGGDESALFTAEMFRLYSRFAERHDWKVKILSSNRTGIGGFKEIIFEIKGSGAYGWFKYESGTHRVQRVPETEKSGRVHTSAVTVAVLPEADEVEIAIKPEDLKVDVYRAGGKGGQSVNTTDSAVRITHLPTGMVASCQDERSQLQNKTKAMQILRSRLLEFEIERLANERSQNRKLQVGSGDRSEKIRTYNFPQDRVTDHRIKKNWHNMDQIMDGDLDDIIESIRVQDTV